MTVAETSPPSAGSDVDDRALATVRATGAVDALREGVSPQGRPTRAGRGRWSTSTATSSGESDRLLSRSSPTSASASRSRAPCASPRSGSAGSTTRPRSATTRSTPRAGSSASTGPSARCSAIAREEIIGRPIFDFVAPEFREQARQAVPEKIRGRPARSSTIERTFVTRDGRRLIVSIEERYKRDEQGRVVGIRSTVQDITDAEADRGGAGGLGAAGPGPLRGDRGRRLRPRPGRPDPRRQPGRQPAARLQPRGAARADDQRHRRPRVRRRLSRTASSSSSPTGTSRARGGTGPRTGRIIPVEINTSTIQFDDQRAVLAVIRDITERKALEETRREFAEAADAQRPRDRGQEPRARPRRRPATGSSPRAASTPSSWPTARAGSRCSTPPPSGSSATRPDEVARPARRPTLMPERLPGRRRPGLRGRYLRDPRAADRGQDRRAARPAQGRRGVPARALAQRRRPRRASSSSSARSATRPSGNGCARCSRSPRSSPRSAC